MTETGRRRSFSAQNGTDIYTRLPIRTHTDEHVVQECLGGPVTLRGIIDRDTNNALGATVDKGLAEALLPVRALLGGKTARGGPLGFESEDGLFRMEGARPFRVRPPGKPFQVNDGPGGGKVVHVAHDTVDGAVAAAANAIRASGLANARLKDFKVGIERETVPPIRSSIPLTDPLLLRGLAKSLFNMAAHAAGAAAVLDGRFDTAREFVLHGSGTRPIGLDTRFAGAFVGPTPYPLANVFVVQGSAKERSAWGFAVLYGRMPYTCLLADGWDGPDFGHRLVVGWDERWDYGLLAEGERFIDLAPTDLAARETDRKAAAALSERLSGDLQQAVTLSAFRAHLADAEREGLSGEGARDEALMRLARCMAGDPAGGTPPQDAAAIAAEIERLAACPADKRRKTKPR